ncbi:hypothetical protein ACHAXT_006782 [Thalassiosira profunda]
MVLLQLMHASSAAVRPSAFAVRRRASTAFSWQSAASIQRRSALLVKVSADVQDFYEEQLSLSDNNPGADILDDASIADAHQQLQPHFPFPLDQWQLSAGASILADQNVIVCAPTGAGKTVVGEMALRVALQREKKAIYTTPLKALSNQKFGEMRKVFGVERVGLATGDVSIRRGADVTIMTTEVYRNMAWRSRTGISSLLDDVDANGMQIDAFKLEAASAQNDDEFSDLSSNSIVVLDEFHYMGEKFRGKTWEECVIFNPPHTQIVGLSATLPNAHRLASWMESTTGRKSILIEANDKRPVPLRYYFCSKRDFSPLFRDEEAGPGAPHGLLGLRGDGVLLTPKRVKKKKKKAGFGKNDASIDGVNRDGMPRGLDLHPSLQSAAERRLANIDRRIQRIVERDSYDEYDGYGRGSTISAREQRKMKENMLKAELRKSVPSIATMLRRLENKDLLPAIFFIFSRKGCDNAAEILCENLKQSAEKKVTDRRPVSESKRKKKGKGKGRGRGRRHSNNNEWDLNEDELAMVQDEDGRNFRADLLDQILADEFDSSMGDDSAVGVGDDEFLSDANIEYYADVGLLSFAEAKEVAARVLSFNTANPEISFQDSVVEQLLCGVGSHHAGILPAHKAFIETLFRLQLMKAVFATETLAAGINMPARTTVICSMAKRGDLGMELLETHNMLQMAGRAGRRGMDVEGVCVVASTAFEGPEDAITILTNEIKPVVSQFAPSYALAVNLVERGSGKLDVARSMVQKSFAVWESRQREQDLLAAMDALDSDDGNGSPEEQFVNALQLTLEKELIEARDGTSSTGTSQSKISKLQQLVDVLADGKKLKKVSKRYSGASQMLDLEQSTLKYLERELREMEETDPVDPELPLDLMFDAERIELMAEIKTQRQRVMKGEREVNSNILSAIAKVANNRMRDEVDESLTNALLTARLHGEDSTFPQGAPLEPGELNAYIKAVKKTNRRPLLDQTTSAQSEDSEDESWNQMLALIRILEASRTHQLRRNACGGHVGSLGMDNPLWQICALGGAWDVKYESAELDRFQEALDEGFQAEDADDASDEKATDIPKPQREAETLRNYLCQLSPSELAGYVSSLVIDAPKRSDSALEAFQKLTHDQQRVVQGALLSLERLVEVQRRLGLDDAIGKCQLELSACDVVTAWASGCSWNDALAISGAAPGDLVRTLSRALDALRQLSNVEYQPARAFDGVASEATGIHPKIRSLAREAANEMDRYPVKDVLPFEEQEEEESESGEDSDSEDEESAATEADERDDNVEEDRANE